MPLSRDRRYHGALHHATAVGTELVDWLLALANHCAKQMVSDNTI